MTAVAWSRGMAAILRDAWPAYALGPADRGGWVMVRFLGTRQGGCHPAGLEREDYVNVSELARPCYPQELDRLHLDHPAHGRGEPWTGAQLRLLRTLWSTMPSADVAARVGHSVFACQVAVYRWWGSKRHSDGLNGRDIARILDCNSHRIGLLAARGLLVGDRSFIGANTRQRWKFAAAELERFLREHPAEYDLAAMPAGPWRDMAAEMHAGAEVWLTTKEAADRMGYQLRTISNRIRRGVQPATWAKGGTARRYGWRIREADLVMA